MADWKDKYSSSYMGIFGMPQLELVRGSGSYVWDADGKKYLDLLGGIAVNALGHAHPAILKALEQASSLMHVSNFFTSPTQIKAAEELLRILDGPEGSRTFLTNSGTESNEAAMKLALAHKPRGRFVALNHGFHGRTLGALSLTWKAVYREPFEPFTAGSTFLEPGDIEALEKELATGDVAAVFMEMIQGEAGVIPLSHDYVVAARELTQKYDALLIVDEVQAGMGRTGRWFGFQAHGIMPDVITLAKGLGGGFPMGAVIGVGEAGSLLKPGQHGTTFGGNPLAAAVAIAVIAEIEQLLDHVTELGESWRADLAAIDGVAEVRGDGLLIGVELESPSAPVAAELLDRGFIVNTPTPTALRLAPALTITADEAQTFTAALADILGR